MDDDKIAVIMWTCMFVFLFGGLALTIINHETGFVCKTQALFNSDSYCYQNYDYNGRMSNVSNGDYDWEIRSHKQNEIDKLNRREANRKKQLELDKQKQCYDEGYLINESFNISEYGLNCKKIAYLNDHLMDNFKKKDSGYISGSYSGLLSRGYVNGKMYQYINDRVLATGMLVQNINYHVDCEDKKHNEKIDYYTEEEFVMYYVEECIK